MCRPSTRGEAIKTVKRKITDLDAMKIQEQKRAVRSGYDMDILPSDLATYGQDAKELLKTLQSRNERMFQLTFLVLNTADTRQKLENDVFWACWRWRRNTTVPLCGWTTSRNRGL